MLNQNPFPESREKQYLRRLHLKFLLEYKKRENRDLAYFGLPSVNMLDVILWKDVLYHVTAVEKVSENALMMYRTAELHKIRDKCIIVEKDLAEILEILAMKDETCALTLSSMSPQVRQNIERVKNIKHDIFNLDFCGGFLYPDSEGNAVNAELFKNLIKYQSKHKHPFILIITFNLRDTGANQYDKYIVDSLNALKERGLDIEKLEEYYLADSIPDQPRNLRRLRFCAPIYIHQEAFNSFQVSCMGAWFYKTLYHTVLLFEPRIDNRTLGTLWPPLDECKALLRSKLTRIESCKDDSIELIELETPYVLI